MPSTPPDRIDATLPEGTAAGAAALTDNPEQPLVPPSARARIALLGILFIALHWDILRRLVRFAWTDGDWSHAFLVPLFSVYFIHQHRDRLLNAVPHACWWGLPIMLLGLGGYFAAIALGNDMLKGYCMIAELFGLTLLMVGPAMMRWLWFPILYLVFAVKISEPIWASIALRMQLFAAESATAVLYLIGIDAEVTQTTIELYRGLEFLGALNVAEACSGLRMLMTFIALGVAVAYLWDRPWWARVTMVLLTVPIAVAVNVGRVTALGALYLIDPKYATGDFHVFLGMLMLIPALALFLLVGWIMDLLVPEEAAI